ncbi:3'-5' exonuclease [Myroides pelagicus]|uniref:DNA polymerase III subunit epsilon n=1 Tax=Myroides pelagicus TaxID=270914 RepID=A0A7K1GI76_9FLAO|nr:3'-5' exonuclease [Myroides pelagicus]MEC4112825.1 3'-5' exonuclease [Myroides pelagicus]MTH28635.1 DNA polymerase III subunit epsilon [Myroides pelagicus]
MDSFVAIDFETANQQRTSVCSVGLVLVENRRIINTYYSLIKPIPDFYSYWNTQVHGLTSWDTREALYFPEIWVEIKEFIQDLPLVAHNSAFDEGCLKAVLGAYDLPLHQNPFYCTCRMARKVFPELVNHKLGTVSKYIGFDLTNHHNALADAEACAHIAIEVF